MAIRKGNTIVPINLPKFHKAKLEVMCSRLGITKSEAIKRMIEAYELFPNKSPKTTLGDLEEEY